jgi:hypothetical protein
MMGEIINFAQIKCADSQQVAEKQDNTLLYVGIGAVLIVLLFFGVWFGLRMMKEDKFKNIKQAKTKETLEKEVADAMKVLNDDKDTKKDDYKACFDAIKESQASTENKNDVLRTYYEKFATGEWKEKFKITDLYATFDVLKLTKTEEPKKDA